MRAIAILPAKAYVMDEYKAHKNLTTVAYKL
jgi:hypothetical protein